MQKGKLYLIPVTLGNNDLRQTLPEPVFNIVNSIDNYVVENIKSAAGFLKAAGIKKPLKELSFSILNINTDESEIAGFLKPAERGEDIALLSEAGVPCVADPGAGLVSLAHENGIQVIPLSGPSSIIIALMASGMNGQNFSFNGYLPIDDKERRNKLKEFERKIRSDNQTQIFIEAPHRNDKLLDALIENCDESLKLCMAKNLTMEDELVVSKKISAWKRSRVIIGKNPAIFLLGK
jgi:16S rRNA (cytidine1402-2'-O)-methyltransferase